jgi:alanine racemase
MPDSLLTIDLDAIAANWRALGRLAAPAEAAAVVKADAYGLGLAPVGRALAAAGARQFFVALASEALALRAALGPGPVIHCLNGLMPGDTAAFAQASIRPVLNAPEQVAWARDSGLDCALQIDTGMNRLGLETAELAAAPLEGLRLTLVMSHLACADEPGHPMNAAQRAAFAAMTADPRLAGLPRSLAATGGTLLGADYHFDLVRPGVGLYGGLPFAAARPVVTLDVAVVQVRDVAAGEAVGYAAAWVAPRPSRIATIASGYADGLIRAMGGRLAAWHGDVALPLVGRVSMDLITLDATDAPGLKPGETVRLLGARQGVDAMAEAAGTIGYEILTSLGTRWPRRYEGAAAS